MFIVEEGDDDEMLQVSSGATQQDEQKDSAMSAFVCPGVDEPSAGTTAAADGKELPTEMACRRTSRPRTARGSTAKEPQPQEPGDELIRYKVGIRSSRV